MIQMPLALQVRLMSLLAALLHHGTVIAVKRGGLSCHHLHHGDQPVSAPSSSVRQGRKKNKQMKHSLLSLLLSKRAGKCSSTQIHRHKITPGSLQRSRDRLPGRDAGSASSAASVPAIYKLTLQKDGRGRKRAQHGKRPPLFRCDWFLARPLLYYL